MSAGNSVGNCPATESRKTHWFSPSECSSIRDHRAERRVREAGSAFGLRRIQKTFGSELLRQARQGDHTRIERFGEKVSEFAAVCRACIHPSVCQPPWARAPVLISFPTDTRFPPVWRKARSTHELGPAMGFSLPTHSGCRILNLLCRIRGLSAGPGRV